MARDAAGERRRSLTRQVNSQLVMEAIMRDGPITRASLARQLDLSKPTISDIVKMLDEAGWIESVGPQRNRMGRAGTEYALRQRAAHVIGVDIGGANVRAAIADLTGDILLERVVATESQSLTSLTTQVSGLCRALARQSQAGWRTVQAVAVGAPGVVDPATGVVRYALNVEALENARFEDVLARTLGKRLMVENDVNMAALGEHRQGHGKGVDNLCFVAIGAGIGMGVILDGELRRGARGAAGEIGAMPVSGQLDAGALPANLQDVAAAGAIARRFAGDSGSAVAASSLPAIFRRAAEGEPAAMRALDEAARALAIAVVNVSAVVDPALIVFGGGAGSQASLIAPVSVWLSRFMREVPEVKLSLLGDRAGLVGCVGMALRAAHESLFAADPRREVAAS